MPALAPLREKLMWFDPLEKPMIFFALALALGYFQILTGLFIAFVHNLKRKQFAAAMFDQLTWLVMLNSIVIFSCSATAKVASVQDSAWDSTIYLAQSSIWATS
jgi:vacuolar-type H+-ATPase subunit I/STV1